VRCETRRSRRTSVPRQRRVDHGTPPAGTAAKSYTAPASAGGGWLGRLPRSKDRHGRESGNVRHFGAEPRRHETRPPVGRCDTGP
jgi:hypothetical protein